MTPYSVVSCSNTLGEGVLWNHLRNVVMWFDIIERKFMTYEPKAQTHQTYSLPVMASAAMLTRHPDIILMASERGLERFDFTTGELVFIKTVEPDRTNNRSNDGKGAPDGSFWVSTMHKQGTDASGSFYRLRLPRECTLPPDIPSAFLREHIIVETMQNNVHIPNGLCFDKKNLFYTDSPTQQLLRIRDYDQLTTSLPTQSDTPRNMLSNTLSSTLSNTLSHSAELFSDTTALLGNPDGSTLDSTGKLWNARWGPGDVHVYANDGTLIETHTLPVSQVSCVAFGGAALTTLYITTARENLTAAQLTTEPLAGNLFALPLEHTLDKGVTEPIFGQLS